MSRLRKPGLGYDPSQRLRSLYSGNKKQECRDRIQEGEVASEHKKIRIGLSTLTDQPFLPFPDDAAGCGALVPLRFQRIGRTQSK
jgi:hypothetical protein